MRILPQTKQTESSKVEAKAKALRAKKTLENIHSFKKVCTFPTCGRPRTQPSGCKGSPGTPARALYPFMRFPLITESTMKKRKDNTLTFIIGGKTKANKGPTGFQEIAQYCHRQGHTLSNTRMI
uniref:Uncharacterized protein n=1 Tax=Buteo japonicus TaxID=224669 RepID=A0A8C0AXP3_9AVES